MAGRLVILPSYNSGDQLPTTMREAAPHCDQVWAVIDGSTDGSGERAAAAAGRGMRVLFLEKNSGKGGAVLHALRLASGEGFTHALVMDADGQHPPGAIGDFFARSASAPDALIAGVPVFGPDAPIERVRGRLAGNFFAQMETWGLGASDSLFGFRLYPVGAALRILNSTRSGRRFDFDTVLAVRLAWAGVPVINVPVAVRYPPASEGGVTHFRYLRDNLLLTAVHVRLCLEMTGRIPRLMTLRRRK